ncbi:MAG: STAS-like domain-containing protein [Candidatus Cloacimonetes bacterium]|nr:STAS-like domain-containing protein [Candidatus Cloacimonadota bacterium]
MEDYRIEIINVVGSEYCIEAEDGKIVYDQIKAAIDNGNRVILSFRNVEILTTSFLNTAVGQLYRDLTDERVKEIISVENMSPSDQAKLKRVNDTAKLYYKNPERMKKTIEEIMED